MSKFGFPRSRPQTRLIRSSSVWGAVIPGNPGREREGSKGANQGAMSGWTTELHPTGTPGANVAWAPWRSVCPWMAEVRPPGWTPLALQPPDHVEWALLPQKVLGGAGEVTESAGAGMGRSQEVRGPCFGGSECAWIPAAALRGGWGGRTWGGQPGVGS